MQSVLLPQPWAALWTVVEEELEPRCRKALDETLEEGLRLGVDPVEVLEDEEERLELGLAQEQALDRVQRSLRALRAVEGLPLGIVDGHVEEVVRIPPVTGITADATGTLYLSALTEDGVLALGTDGKLRMLIRDDRVSGLNEGSIGPDGYYYSPNSQAARVNRPYEVFQAKLA